MNVDPVLLSIGLGVVGATTRIVVQVHRDDKLPSLLRGASLIYLGAVGGGISALLQQGWLGALALGYGASDLIENLLARHYPKE